MRWKTQGHLCFLVLLVELVESKRMKMSLGVKREIIKLLDICSSAILFCKMFDWFNINGLSSKCIASTQ